MLWISHFIHSRRAGPIAVSILLAGMVWLVFGRTLRHDFVNYDDTIYVRANPVVEKGITLNGIVWAFTHSHGDNWHPLTTISHMLDCQVYGLQPWGHHLTNVLLHGTAAILLFFVLRQMTGASWRSAFVATVFAIHPLRVESVAWISERKDVLSGVFFMLTLLAYDRYVQHPWSLRRYGAVIIFLALGLMSKPTLVTVPFLLLLLDYWPLNRLALLTSKASSVIPPTPPPARLVVEKIPLFALSAACCTATLWAQKGAVDSIEWTSFSSRIANALVSYVI